MSDQQTLSIPSLLLLAAISALAVRYFFFSKPSATNPAVRPSRRIANPADVEQITTMFPQIPRRNIIWDLQRNGGGVGATTERILGTGELDTPPPTFQPPVPTGSTTSTANTVPGQTRTEQIDLIQRYNLAERLASPSQNPSSKSISQGAGKLHDGQAQWSNNKMERQALFQRRREEMVLNARKTMEEKEKQGHGERMVF